MDLFELLMIPLLWGAFVLYLALQIFAPIRLRGAWRWLSLLPIPIMSCTLYVTVVALKEGSNIWPILLLLSSPVAALFLLLLVVFVPNRSRLSTETEEDDEVRL